MLNLATLEDGRKAIIIRTSDRINFKQCRRKWAWSSHLRQNLGAKNLAAPLWFGSAIHYALEDFHGWNHFKRASNAFRAFCIATSKQNVRQLPIEANELYELGIAMMDYYEDFWLKERTMTQTYWEENAQGILEPQCEVNFSIPIPLNEYPQLAELARRNGADTVLYRGTIDRVGIDEYGNLWCVAKDTWVGSTKGIHKIQDHPDAKFMGVKSTVVICAEGGYRLECTPDHKVLTSNRSWVEAQELSFTDELVLGDYSDALSDADRDFWWVTGYWYGDGSLRNHGRGSIDFSTGLDNEELSGYLNEFFTLSNESVRYAINNSTTGYAYVTNQAAFADHLRNLFSSAWSQGKTKYKKNSYIPLDRIGNIRAFLCGLFDADGTVGKRRDGYSTISLANKSHEVIEQVQQVLAMIGIKSSIRIITRDHFQWSTLTISNGASVHKFKTLIGFRLKRKQDSITVTPTLRYRGPRVIEVLPGREVEVYDVINQPNTQFNAGGLQVHNCVEYKTAKRAEHGHYMTDPQVTTYIWAMQHIYKQPVAGVIYYQFIKDEPKLPRILSSGKISTASNLASSVPLYRKQLTDLYGSVTDSPRENQEFLATLSRTETENKDRYIVRERVTRNAQQCDSEAVKIILEMEDMLNPDLPLYPNPTRQCPYMCSFLGPCITMDDGGDWETELNQEFDQRDQAPDRMWRNRLPSVDKLLTFVESGLKPDLESLQDVVRSAAADQRAQIEAGTLEVDIPFTFD